jgi:hypothetical protein
MKGIDVAKGSFTPKGCNVSIEGTGAYMTAGAGVQMFEAYAATAKTGYTVLGGNGRTVALGGYLTGGGHSILAPTYGLAADHVLEVEMVTPGGELVTANECQNTDLFWAARGGGGGTFGVLTKITTSVLPSPELVSMEFLLTINYTNKASFDMISKLVSNFPTLADKGVSGYPIILHNSPWLVTYANGSLGLDLVNGMLGKLIMIKTKNKADIEGLFTPIFKEINATWPNQMTTSMNTTYYPSFYAWWSEHFDPSPVGHENLIASRLLDTKALTGNATALKGALEKFSAGGQATVFIVSGKGVHDAKPRGGGNAVLPAWRKAYVHASESSSCVNLPGPQTWVLTR